MLRKINVRGVGMQMPETNDADEFVIDVHDDKGKLQLTIHRDLAQSLGLACLHGALTAKTTEKRGLLASAILVTPMPDGGAALEFVVMGHSLPLSLPAELVDGLHDRLGQSMTKRPGIFLGPSGRA